MANIELSRQAILDAAAIIDPIFLNTPQFELDTLNSILDLRLVLKVETLNPIRSFKGRGTDYFVRRHSHEPALVCASAGNFGQGMAYACQKHNISLTVFAAQNANSLKLKRMRQLGAEVQLAGEDFDAAKDAGKAYALAINCPFVEDGREPEVSIGAGTIGLELSRYPQPIDTLLMPLGNGALINGIGTWFKREHPTTQVIGIVAAGAPSMQLSWLQGCSVETEAVNTIADGIAVRSPVTEALRVMKTTVDDVICVSDEVTLQAMKQIHELAGIVVEPAGAVGVAAAIAYKEKFSGQLIATPLCGSNLTKDQMTCWL